MIESNQANNDIFQLLPDDLIGEIVSHLTSIDSYFTIGRVSKNWRRLCVSLIWKEHEETIRKFKLKCSGYEELDDLFMASDFQALNFIKYLMRRRVYDFVCKLEEMATYSKELRVFTVNNEWIDEELSILKGYFNQFRIGLDAYKPVAKTGLFESVSKFVGSFFSKSSSSASDNTSNNKVVSNNSKTKTQEQKKVPYFVKVLLDGGMSSGKSSFMQSIVNNASVLPLSQNLPLIGVDFFMTQFKIGKEEIKLQLWDQYSNDRVHSTSSSFYRASSVILLLGNPFSDSVKKIFDFKKEEFARHATDPEVVLLTTRSDLDQSGMPRFITVEEADCYAFENFQGGLHFHMSNSNLKTQKNIVWYSVLMKYFLTRKDQ